MFSRRSLTAALAAVTAVGVLAACTASPDSTPDDDGQPSGTLTVAHWDFLAPAYGEEMQAIIKAYEDFNPNATIETVGIVRDDSET